MFHSQQGNPNVTIPIIDRQPLDVWALRKAVTKIGSADKVSGGSSEVVEHERVNLFFCPARSPARKSGGKSLETSASPPYKLISARRHTRESSSRSRTFNITSRLTPQHSKRRAVRLRVCARLQSLPPLETTSWRPHSREARAPRSRKHLRNVLAGGPGRPSQLVERTWTPLSKTLEQRPVTSIRRLDWLAEDL
jgi:hypothetical protein